MAFRWLPAREAQAAGCDRPGSSARHLRIYRFLRRAGSAGPPCFSATRFRWRPDGAHRANCTLIPSSNVRARRESGTEDSLQLLLSEIATHRLLGPAEEVALAKRIERGDIVAKHRMVESNLRLVVSIAKRYRG